MKSFVVCGLILGLLACGSMTIAQDGALGKGKGKGSSGGSSGGSGGSSGGGKGSSGSGKSGPGNGSGGGQSSPPVRSGGQSSPPIRSGGQSRGNPPVQANPGRRGIPDANAKDARGSRPQEYKRVEPPSSRSGRSNYEGNNNLVRSSRAPQSPGAIRSVPSQAWNGSLRGQVLREEEIRIGSFSFRSGYYQYDNRWNDCNFRYPYYSFDWSPRNCVVSPWYYYPNLPAYVIMPRVDFGRLGFTIECVDPYYGWHTLSDYRWRDVDRDLNYALEDLTTAFERQNYRALGYMVPSGRERVGIYVEGEYRYSISSDDYYDMMLDLISSTRTTRYTILQVRLGRDAAKVLAAHDYLDPWGNRMTTYHHYTLQQDRRGYQIVEFGSSCSRSGFPIR